MIGALLGERYRLLDVIGHGGAGRVYRAIQEPIGREVAVKLMHAELDPEGVHDFQARFLREAALAGRIQHPHVVTVHDYGRTDDGICYIVMEHLRGRTLRSVMRAGALPVDRALRIFEQLVRGLGAAHRAGLVHRDVKPSNVILLQADDGGDFLKLFDFGLVKGDDEATITQAGMFVGTPQYVAPEQAKGDCADARSDLYSAGVILFRMLTGVLPYTGESPLSIAWMHIRDELPTMSERAPDVKVPAELELAVRRLLEKAPSDRYPDAEHVLAVFAQVRADLGLDAGTAGSVRPGRPRQPQDPPSLSSSAGLAEQRLETSELDVDSAHAGRTAAIAPPAWTAAPRTAARPRQVALGALVGVALLLGAGAVGRQLARGAAREEAGTETRAETRAETPAVAPQPVPVPEISLLVSSDPTGAQVWLGDVLLGLTPLARGLALLPEDPLLRTFDVKLEGYEDQSLALDLGQARVAGHVVLKRRPAARRPSPSPSPSLSPSPSPAVRADGVLFSAEQAHVALTWLNGADAAALRGAGITARQVTIIQAGQPFADLSAFAATPWIGPKTVERVKAAGSS